MLSHLDCVLSKLRPHRRGQVEHPDALALNPNHLQQLLDPLDSSLGVDITVPVMAITFQSARNHHAVGAILKGPQGKDDVQFAAARQLDDLDGGRILEPEPASQVRSRVRAIMARKCYDLWLKLMWIHFPTS
jgi:hypothetical protein